MTRIRDWTMHELALAVGLRALGEDYDAIARSLLRPRDDVVVTLHRARCLIRAEGWVGPLIDARNGCRAEPGDRVDPAAAVRRAYRVRPDIDEVAGVGGGDVTAALMGDPSPGRSALDQRNAAKRAV